MSILDPIYQEEMIEHQEYHAYRNELLANADPFNADAEDDYINYLHDQEMCMNLKDPVHCTCMRSELTDDEIPY